jgi:RHS repeat-associated protein
MPANAVPCYDIAGNLLFQHSMDAGDRWMLMDAAGKPMLAWDENNKGDGTPIQKRLYETEYDALHRPTAQWLTVDTDVPIMVERYEYRDTNNPDGTPNPQLVQDKTANLLGQLIRHYDPSGLIETVRRDFKGNVQEVHRTLVQDATASVVDWQGSLAGKLETETYLQHTEYDALNRMMRQENWHKLGGVGAVYTPTYNKRGVLQSETLTLRGTVTEAIEEIRYNAKGQKEYLKLGNGTLTQYEYDQETFRLKQLRTTRPSDASDFPERHSNLQDIGVIQQLHYTYDPVGNITEVYDEAYKPVFFANAIVEPKSLYEYDALYRLISASGRENGNASATEAPGQFDRVESTAFPIQAANAMRRYTQRYQYDSVGNILQIKHILPDTANGWTRNYDYAFNDPAQPASNRLWRTWEHAPRWNDSDARNKVTYHHDTHGNMLNLANVAPGQHLRWDHRDMIRNLDLGGGGQAYYQYDAGKQRTRKRIVNQNNLGGYWERIYLPGYELYRRYNGANPTTPVEEIESHHLIEGEQRVLLVDDVITASGMANPRPDGLSVKKQTLFRYQYSNHLGSACLELDHHAEIISYEEYHPYGTSAYRAVKSGIEAPPKRYRYTGMERDEESGLGYHATRYFPPRLARWISVDKTLADGANLYAYVKGNPIRFRDQSGTQSLPIPNPQQLIEMGFASGFNFVFGGDVTIRDGHVEWLPPEPIRDRGVSGMYGGAVSTISLRLIPISPHASPLGLAGAELGAEQVPVLNSAEKLISGTTVTGQPTNRTEAAAFLAIELLPFALEGLTVLRQAQQARAARVATQRAWVEASLESQQASHTLDIRDIQAKQVRDAAQEVTDVIGRTLSRAERGPVYTSVLDTVTGEVFGGLNLGSKGHAPTAAELMHLRDNLHPLLKQRLETLESQLNTLAEAGMLTREELRAGVAGAHSEVVALNKAILARESALGVSVGEADLSSFLVYNKELRSAATSASFGVSVPPPCINCSYIVQGTQIIH